MFIPVQEIFVQERSSSLKEEDVSLGWEHVFCLQHVSCNGNCTNTSMLPVSGRRATFLLLEMYHLSISLGTCTHFQSSACPVSNTMAGLFPSGVNNWNLVSNSADDAQGEIEFSYLPSLGWFCSANRSSKDKSYFCPWRSWYESVFRELFFGIQWCYFSHWWLLDENNTLKCRPEFHLPVLQHFWEKVSCLKSQCM